MNSRSTFTALDTEWLDHINENSKGKTTPIAIVGTKSDLDNIVTENDAYLLQEQINAESVIS